MSHTAERDDALNANDRLALGLLGSGLVYVLTLIAAALW